jgi:hypothetical protein
MQHRTLTLAVFLLASVAAMAAHAATITAISVTPSTVRAGEPFTVTISGDGESPNCGIRLQFNDAIPTESFSLSDRGGTLPLTLNKTIDKPGVYKVEALGRKAGALVFGCNGEAATTITVVAAAGTAATAATAGTGGAVGSFTAQCPAGWEMISGQKDPSKGFTCAPLRPATRLDCGKMLYFEKDGLIGCKKRK